MHMREVSPVLDRVVRRHHTRGYHQNTDDVIFHLYHRAHVHHHASERDLIQIVVQDLAQRAAIVRSSRLLTIDGVNRLVPEVREPGEEPYPAWRRLRETRIERHDNDEDDQWEN